MHLKSLYKLHGQIQFMLKCGSDMGNGQYNIAITLNNCQYNALRINDRWLVVFRNDLQPHCTVEICEV